MRKLIFALCVFSSLPAFAIHDVGGGAGGGGSVADPLTLNMITVSTLNINGQTNITASDPIVNIANTRNSGTVGATTVSILESFSSSLGTSRIIADDTFGFEFSGPFKDFTGGSGTQAAFYIGRDYAKNAVNGITIADTNNQSVPATITAYFQDVNGGTSGHLNYNSGTSQFSFDQAFTGSNPWTNTSYIVTNSTIGSNGGWFNMAGTTITTSAPTIDTNDRIWTLNNRVASWKQAVTDGARLTVWNDFIASSSNTYEAGSTVAVRGMFLDSSLSAGTSGYVYTSRGNGVSPQWLPGGAGGGVANPMTGNLNAGGFTISNYGGEGWYVQPASTTFNSGATIPTSSVTLCTVNLQTSSTYTFTAWMRYHGSGSAAGGVKFNFTTPTGSTVSWTMGAPNNSATTYRADQGADGSNVDNPSAVEAFNSAANNEIIIYGYVTTDSTHSGPINWVGVAASASGVMTCDFATLEVKRTAPLP